MRVFIDTNVLVSVLLNLAESGSVRAIFQAFTAARFILLISGKLIDELTETVRAKPRLSKRITEERLNRFVSLLMQTAELIDEIEEPIPSVTRDPDDDYVLAYALVGAADYLITGDNDLLSLQGQIAGLEIVTPTQFVEILSSR